MSDKDIEQEIQAKGKTAPRVTPDHISNIIVSEHYFTAAEGVHGANEKLKPEESPIDYYQEVNSAEHLLTFCVLVLRNGFTVTGESACASPENFDAEIGRKIARDNAVQKVWQLEGYLLKQRLYVQTGHSIEDMFQHFLSYTNQSDQPVDVIENLRLAYEHGESAADSSLNGY